MKILFVDDEDRILSGIENALLFDYDNWEVEFANSGRLAIQRLSEDRFDVLVTDMQMPGLTGADVLEHAKNQSPDTVRIVLSGEVDEGLAQRSMALTHEFVSKPCEPATLFEIITRVFNASRPLTTSAGVGALSILDRLPSQPNLYLRVQEAIENRASIDALARIIESDVAITGSIIRTANSSFYGFRNPVQFVRDAVSRLGNKTLTGLLLHAELSAWTPPALTNVVARLNSQAARRSHVVSSLLDDDAALGGQASLLCDIGILALLTLHPNDVHHIEEVIADGATTAEKELVLFGATHAEVGAAMLRMWNFAPTVVDTVRFHHDYRDAEEPVRTIAETIASVELAASIDAGHPQEGSDRFDHATLRRVSEAWERAVQS